MQHEANSSKILRRVAELADKRGVTMAEIFPAWMLIQVTAPVAGATGPHHIEGAAKAVGPAYTKADDCYIPNLVPGDDADCNFLIPAMAREAQEDKRGFSFGRPFRLGNNRARPQRRLCCRCGPRWHCAGRNPDMPAV